MSLQKGTRDRKLNIKAQVYAADKISEHVIKRFPFVFDNIFLDDLAEMLYHAYLEGYDTALSKE